MLVGIIFQSILIKYKYISGIGKSTFIFLYIIYYCYYSSGSQKWSYAYFSYSKYFIKWRNYCSFLYFLWTFASFAWAYCNFMFFSAKILLYFRKESRVNSLCCSCRFISAYCFLFFIVNCQKQVISTDSFETSIPMDSKIVSVFEFFKSSVLTISWFCLFTLVPDIFLYTWKIKKEKKTAYNNQ